MPVMPRVGSPVPPWSDQEEQALSDLVGDPHSQTHSGFQDGPELTSSELVAEQSRIHSGFQDVESAIAAAQQSSEGSGESVTTKPLNSEMIAKKIKDIRKKARRRRLRISLPASAFGLTSFGLGVSMGVFLQRDRKLNDYKDQAFFILALIFANVGILSLLVALLPSDRRAVPCAMGIYILISLATIFSPGVAPKIVSNGIRDARETGCLAGELDEFEYTGEGTFPCFISWLLFVVGKLLLTYCISFGATFYLCIRLYNSRRSQTHERLVSMWCCVCVNFASLGFLSVLRAPVALLLGKFLYFISEIGRGACLFSVAFLSHPRFALRSRAQSWLSSFGEGTTVAGGVAELLGNESIESLIAKAKNNFYYVSADVLTKEDMMRNTPDPALFQFVQKGVLGEIDAFVSHSWSDDANAKWLSLQNWIEDFKEKQGRTPTLWIDKYCIDQQNIDEALMCLPLYLSGCRQMLVLCGETYLHRLWCLVEIFVFATMLGQQAMIETRFLNKDSTTHTKPLDSLLEALQCFDPGDAQCSTAYDTLRLRDVIEASDMGKDGLTELVRSTFLHGKVSERFSRRVP